MLTIREREDQQGYTLGSLSKVQKGRNSLIENDSRRHQQGTKVCTVWLYLWSYLGISLFLSYSLMLSLSLSLSLSPSLSLSLSIYLSIYLSLALSVSLSHLHLSINESLTVYQTLFHSPCLPTYVSNLSIRTVLYILLSINICVCLSGPYICLTHNFFMSVLLHILSNHLSGFDTLWEGRGERVDWGGGVGVSLSTSLTISMSVFFMNLTQLKICFGLEVFSIRQLYRTSKHLY